MALTRCAARSPGFWLSFFASSKHNDEASCPNSGFGGLLNDRFSTFISGRVFFSACANVVSHSFWNSAKGFLEVILVFLAGLECGKPLRGGVF
jgi:hypothetical protein